ncbi:hypothetical protein EC988_000287 [Linderina pennispora]|nr:hypothetical protein EC988_000287 [Linderina pennispora]
MQRLSRALVPAASVHGRIASIVAANRSPLAKSIVRGTAKTRLTKLHVKQKVAWAHAQPVYLTYTQFLTHALAIRSIGRLHTVLKRMLDDSVRQMKPTGVSAELLDKCAHRLVRLFIGAKGRHNEIGDTAGIMEEIAWRTGHPTDNTLWSLLRFLAHRAGASVDKYASELRPLRFAEADVDLLLEVVQSPRSISREVLVDLHKRSAEVVQASPRIAAAFYIAAMREEETVIPYDIRESLARSHDAIAQANGSPASGASQWQTLLALAHLLIAQGQHAKARNLVGLASHMSTSAEWPLTALPAIIADILATGRDSDALELLRSIATRNYAQYVSLAGKLLAFRQPNVMVSLLADELEIRLQTHKPTSELKRLPVTAFFIPNLRYNMDIPGVRELFAGYYTRAVEILGLGDSLDVDLIRALVSEAGAWAFRVQSAEPVEMLVNTLLRKSMTLDPQGMLVLLHELTMILRNISMVHYADKNGIPRNKDHYITLTPLASRTSSYGPVRYTDPLHAFRLTRRALLATYLSRGIEPPVEALTTLYLHMAGTGDRGANKLAANIFGDIPPSLTSRCSRSSLVMQAFYEQQLLKAAQSRRWLIRLFQHILGHTAVDSVEFQQRIVSQTVVQFLNHRHFMDLGFFALEKAFIRFVDRPRFTPEYLNTVRPRFWAMHMFLRKRSYVARLVLHDRMFRVHKYKLFVMQATSIPCASKMKTQGVSRKMAEVNEQDVATAINIFMNAVPPDRLGTERYSTERMIEQQTRVVKPHSDAT